MCLIFEKKVLVNINNTHTNKPQTKFYYGNIRNLIKLIVVCCCVQAKEDKVCVIGIFFPYKFCLHHHLI